MLGILLAGCYARPAGARQCWFTVEEASQSMRFLLVVFLAVIAVVEIGPVPITPLVLLWVVLFRPKWFYELVLKLYR